MKVLQVTHLYFPESRGGTETHVHLLAQALAARHEVAICAHLQDYTRAEHTMLRDAYDGLPVYRLVNNFTWGGDAEYFFYDPGQDALFAEVLDAVRPDVVHFHHLGGGLSTSFVGIVRRRGLPLVLTLHDLWPMCYRSHLLTTDGRLCPGPDDGLRCVRCWSLEGQVPQSTWGARAREVGLANTLRMAPGAILRALAWRVVPMPGGYHATRLMARDAYLRRLLGRFDRLVAPSRFLRGHYVEWGVPPERILHLQNGVHPAHFAGLRRELPNGERLAVAYLGSLLPQKGLDVLIDAANALADAPIDLTIHGRITGRRETEEYVRSLRARLTNPHVTFAGPYDPTELGRVLSAADVVVVPSILYENCPMVILEAQYAGRPVVTSNVGGMAELVRDGVDGRTFRVGDAGDLAACLRALAADREALLALQRGITPPQTMATVAERIEALYDGVCDARSAYEAGREV
jgi:glycosyltransferase involved in cell wall biosynthesis